MKHLKEYEDEEIKGAMDSLQDVGLGSRPDVPLNQWNFFEETEEYPQYVDVSGPVCEMVIDDLVNDFKERVDKIPEEDRLAALGAIQMLWMKKIKDLMKP
jgi:hypothetical protein